MDSRRDQEQEHIADSYGQQRAHVADSELAVTATRRGELGANTEEERYRSYFPHISDVLIREFRG